MNIVEYAENILYSMPPTKEIDAVIKLITQKAFCTVFTCGNGGSGANASHFTQDLLHTINTSSVCLNDNIGFITATSNDIAFDDIFRRQIEILSMDCDILFCISGSGNSKNILRACDYAKRYGIKIVGLVGFDGGKLKEIADYVIHVASDDMRTVESAHSIVLHYIIDRLENEDKTLLY